MKNNKYLYIQMCATILFIFCLIINIILVYNQILINNKEKEIIKKEDIPLIVTINKVIVLFLLYIFLYISYKNYDETTKSKLEIIGSLLTFISGLIILYSVVRYNDITLENPID